MSFSFRMSLDCRLIYLIVDRMDNSQWDIKRLFLFNFIHNINIFHMVYRPVLLIFNKKKKKLTYFSPVLFTQSWTNQKVSKFAGRFHGPNNTVQWFKSKQDYSFATFYNLENWYIVRSKTNVVLQFLKTEIFQWHFWI